MEKVKSKQAGTPSKDAKLLVKWEEAIRFQIQYI